VPEFGFPGLKRAIAGAFAPSAGRRHLKPAKLRKSGSPRRMRRHWRSCRWRY
jgi:hypothetical protein